MDDRRADDQKQGRWHAALQSVTTSSRPNGSGTTVPAAVGGDVTPTSILEAFAVGLVPLDTDDAVASIERAKHAGQVDPHLVVAPTNGDPWRTTWWSPDPRPVIYEAADLRLGRSLTNTLRTQPGLTIDTAAEFDIVMDGCRSHRSWEWLTERLVGALRDLFEQGDYLAVGAWLDGELIGGAVALSAPGVISVDSMFGASGSGLACVATLVVQGLEQGRAIDFQWPSRHSERLVSVAHPRERFLAHLAAASPSRPFVGSRTTSEQILSGLRGIRDSARPSS